MRFVGRDLRAASLDQDTFLRIWKRVDKFLEKKSRIYIEHNPVIGEYVKMRIDIKEKCGVREVILIGGTNYAEEKI